MIDMRNLEKSFEEKTNKNFKDFYKTYRPKLVWYLYRYTKDMDKANDFAADAFMQALLNINTYKTPDEGGAQIHTWLYKVAENIVKKAYKDDKKLPLTSMDKEFNENVNLKNLLPYNDGKKEIDQYKIVVKKAQVVKDAIYNLPDNEKDLKYKKVLIMREIEGMAYKEISETLNINLSTIKSQIRKGRKIIKKKTTKILKEIDENGLE